MKNLVYFKKLFKSIIILTLSVLLFYSFGLISDKKNVLANVKNNKQNIEVFKTPSCGCCYGYVFVLVYKMIPRRIEIKLHLIGDEAD